MKRNNTSFKLFSVLVAAFLIFSSCQIGLGSAIDLEAPEVFLTSHKDSDYVGQNFRLAGTASDNEKVKKLSIDFDEADIHFVLENGVWKKKTSYTADWVTISADESLATVDGKTINWAIDVSTEEAKSGIDSTYIFTIVVEDFVGNSGKNSKLEGSLIVDENIPEISIKTPELFKTNTDLTAEYEKLQLQDGNVLAQLLNGTLVLEGRQDSAASFKEFRIEFDNGIVDSKTVDSTNFDIPIGSVTTENISAAYPFERSAIYYSKTLTVGKDNITDLRTWKINVAPSDWISAEKNPELTTGKHKIRVVATGISSSNTWQRKVLGYFVWYPEADKPWITLYSGSNSLETVSGNQTYPSTKIFGLVQDDDGIANLTYSLEKRNSDGSFSSIKNNEELILAEANAKNSQWNIESPAESAVYKLTVNTKDIYDNTDSITKYFNVLDVQPPKITLTVPESSSSILVSGSTKLKFDGTISDDGLIKKIKIVHLNPSSTALENKIKYINTAEDGWNLENASDSIGNFVYNLEVPQYDFDANTKIYSYKLNKEFDLFSDLKISESKPLVIQSFVILAVDDAGGSTVYPIDINGDSEVPNLKLLSIKHNDKTYYFGDNSVTLPLIKKGDEATISGSWSDNSTNCWKLYDKIGNISLSWSNAEFYDIQMQNGTWTAKVKNLPSSSSSITASLKDFANNEAIVSETIIIDKAEIGLERIGCENEDKSYSVGSEIILTLEFTKSAKFQNSQNKTPTLTLNNKKEAVYLDGNETSKIRFKYTVEAKDDIDKLLVTKINNNECTWQDLNTKDEYIMPDDVITELDKTKKLDSRNIIIDTVSPFINDIKCLSKEDYYKFDTSLMFKIEFNEDVSINNVEKLKLLFKNFTPKGSFETKQTGSKTILITYNIAEGDNVSQLQFDSVSSDNVIIKDNANNSWSSEYNEPDFSNISIDTDRPLEPTFTIKDKNENVIINNDVVTDETLFENGKGLNVELLGEQGNLWYSLDGGSTWTEYSEKLTLTNNGSYKICAKQIDRAGNESTTTEVTTITIDKGALLKKISATNPNGTYPAGKTINGYLEFRDTVTIPKDASVTLENLGSKKTCIIKEAKDGEATGSKFTFDYLISDGESTGSNKLDVSVDFKVTYKDVEKTITTPVSNFISNKEIYISANKPSISSVNITGEDSNAIITVEFNKEVSKGSGTITLTQDSDTFRVPTVLTVAEYNDLKATLGNAIDTYYKKGVNGATLNSDNTLTPDTSTKYILDFTYDNTDETLCKLFIDKKLHIVEIPIYSSAVSVSGSTLTAKLTGEFKLPVKGAEYSVSISEGAVKDSVGNENELNTATKIAPGVEKPEIRIQKNGYKISWTNTSSPTTNSDVTMPETASMKISCRTPGATIKYSAKSQESNEVMVNDVVYHNTKTGDVEVSKPTDNTDAYTQNTPVTLGSTISNNKFSNAKGLKIAIAAYSKKGDDQEDAYEYAARTVLKFEVNNGFYDNSPTKDTNISENNTKLKTNDLKVWVTGGDASSGDNTIETFPLSWRDFSKFKLMKVENNGNPTGGNWYWITWDLSAPAYHGFVAGDVPLDANDNGPTTCYPGQCTWNPLKSNYVLHPGETLRMQLTTGHNNGGRANYYFAIKNEITRN
ncbi:MAG: hypothetical protein IJZ71_02210 [Treponema sp.]|nr:hypothetical protein [Treponema sp.]